MFDLVCAENLPKSRGIKRAVAASSLKNFRQPKNEPEARADCRVRNVLLYSSSYEFDDGIYIDLARAGGAVVFSFSDILRERGFRRSIALSKMRLSFNSCRKNACGFVVCTMAENENEVRNARELGAFMAVLGMNEHEKLHAEKTLAKLVR